MKILVTGAGGFIGFHLSRRLLEEGLTVVGLDNLNAYYDVMMCSLIPQSAIRNTIYATEGFMKKAQDRDVLVVQSFEW